jgi:hypothetical protein
MDSADRYELDFLRVLCSAERFSDAAIRFASFSLNTPLSRSSALLSRVTRADQRRADFVFVCDFRGARLPCGRIVRSSHDLPFFSRRGVTNGFGNLRPHRTLAEGVYIDLDNGDELALHA